MINLLDYLIRKRHSLRNLTFGTLEVKEYLIMLGSRNGIEASGR